MTTPDLPTIEAAARGAAEASTAEWRRATSDPHWAREVRDTEGDQIAWCGRVLPEQAHAVARHIATASPAAVLALCARIRELEAEREANFWRGVCAHAATVADTQGAALLEYVCRARAACPEMLSAHDTIMRGMMDQSIGHGVCAATLRRWASEGEPLPMDIYTTKQERSGTDG